jgi:hypothetical protein
MANRWEQIRQQVLYRDNYTCQSCNNETNALGVHHIIPHRKAGTDTIDNLITYCPKCHMKLEPRESEARRADTITSKLRRTTYPFNSLSTIIPITLVRQWKLTKGDRINWSWEAINNEMVLREDY